MTTLHIKSVIEELSSGRNPWAFFRCAVSIWYNITIYLFGFIKIATHKLLLKETSRSELRGGIICHRIITNHVKNLKSAMN